jgi:hypothetical protein
MIAATARDARQSATAPERAHRKARPESDGFQHHRRQQRSTSRSATAAAATTVVDDGS